MRGTNVSFENHHVIISVSDLTTLTKKMEKRGCISSSCMPYSFHVTFTVDNIIWGKNLHLKMGISVEKFLLDQYFLLDVMDVESKHKQKLQGSPNVTS